MSIEDIIRAWKTDEETLEPCMPTNPVGRELDEQELLNISGGCSTLVTVIPTCDPSGGPSCQLGTR